jgi:hypothetical protein
MSEIIGDTGKKKSANRNMFDARNAKVDEFYTQLTDIEKELVHYGDQFRGKTVYCNCDDPDKSNFFHYFRNNFESLGMKKLIGTGLGTKAVIITCEAA